MDFQDRKAALMDRTTKGRVLLAEDNDTIRKLLSRVLSNEGYIIEAVDNGLDAKMKLASGPFDVVLSDILMPGVSGIEILKEVRDNFGDIPVILITGNQSLENAKEAIHWGAFDYITKPFNDISFIKHAVHRAMVKSRLQLEKEGLISELDRKNVHLKSVVRELDKKNARLDLLVRDLNWAMQLGAIMTSNLEVEEMIDGLTEGVFEIFNVCAWGVLLYDGSEGEKSRINLYKTRQSMDSLVDNLVQMALKDYYRISRVMLSDQDVTVNLQEKIMTGASLMEKHYQSAPLVLKDKNLGLIFVFGEKKEGFEQAKRHTLSLIASQLSAALENASLFHQVTQRNKELKELSEFKDEVLGIAAHDLRSPLASINMSAMLLRDFAEKMKPEEKVEAIDGIAQKAQHMIDMLNEMLDISVIESGNLVLKTQVQDIKPIVMDHYSQVAPLARSKNIEILVDMPEELPPVNVDRKKIGEVMDNLLSNAVKYTRSGGNVFVKVEQEDAFIHVEVRDSGVGIKEEELEKLFIKFSRTSAKPTGGETSTGLGLAIAKKIVDLHQGEIWAESQYGKGSTFHFQLPIHDPEKSPEESSDNSSGSQ